MPGHLTTPPPPLRSSGRQSPIHRWRSVFGLTCGFACLGPLAGTGLLLVWSMMLLPDGAGRAALTLLDSLLLLPFFLYVGFLLGTLPAATTGLLYALIRPWVRPGWLQTLLAANCGAGVMLATWVAVSWDYGIFGVMELAHRRWSSLLTTAAHGAGSAAISLWLCQAVMQTWQHARQRALPQAATRDSRPAH